ncbi:hypothetical protein DL96DRAFT_1607441, partial [Flagelloscypha sp. PMI_526]
MTTSLPNLTSKNYLFKSEDSSVSLVLQDDANSHTSASYYTIKTEDVPLSPFGNKLISLWKGCSGSGGKLIASFETSGLILVAKGKSYPISKSFRLDTSTPSNRVRSTRVITCTIFDSEHVWQLDPSNPLRLIALAKRSTKISARYTPSQKALALWEPEKYLHEPLLEIFPTGVDHAEEVLVSLLVILLGNFGLFSGLVGSSASSGANVDVEPMFKFIEAIINVGGS